MTKIAPPPQLAPAARSSVHGAVVLDGGSQPLPVATKATAAAAAADAADEYDEGLQRIPELESAVMSAVAGRIENKR